MRSTVITCSAILVAGSVAQHWHPDDGAALHARDAYAEADPYAEADAFADADPYADAEAEAEADAYANANPWAEADAEAEAEADLADLDDDDFGHAFARRDAGDDLEWAESTGDLPQFDGPTESPKLHRRQELANAPHGAPQNYPSIHGGGYDSAIKPPTEAGQNQIFSGLGGHSMPNQHESFKTAPSLPDHHDPFGEHGGQAMHHQEMKMDYPMSQHNPFHQQSPPSFHEPPPQAHVGSEAMQHQQMMAGGPMSQHNSFHQQPQHLGEAPPPKHWTSQVQDHIDKTHSKFFAKSHGRMKDMHQAEGAFHHAPAGPEKARLEEEYKAKKAAYHGTRIGRMNEHVDTWRNHLKAGHASVMDAHTKLMDKELPLEEKAKMFGQKYTEFAGRFHPRLRRRSLSDLDMPMASPALRRRSFDDDFVGSSAALHRRSLDDDDVSMSARLARRRPQVFNQGEAPVHHSNVPSGQPGGAPMHPGMQPPEPKSEPKSEPKPWGHHVKEAPGKFHDKFKDNSIYKKASGQLHAQDKYWSGNKHYNKIKGHVQKHGQKAHEYMSGAANSAQEKFNKMPGKDKIASYGQRFREAAPHGIRARDLEFAAESDRLMAHLERRAAFEGRLARIQAAEEY